MKETMINLCSLNITEIGSEVELFIEENMFILFHESAPPELKDIAVSHDGAFTEQILTGDELVIDDEVFLITCVGSKANDTLQELGHVTLCFNGAASSDLPGQICLEQKQIPVMSTQSKIIFRRK